MPVLSEADIYLGLAEYLKAANPSFPLTFKATHPTPLDGVEEWATFELLNYISNPSQSIAVIDEFTIQISCYSLHAQHRQDRKIARHIELASFYKGLVHQKSVNIKNTCIRFKDAKIVYLDLRSVADFAKPMYQNNPAMQTMLGIVLIDGQQITSKD